MEISSQMSVSEALYKTQVSLVVQKLAMNDTQQNADQLRQMMERSLNPSVGGNIDISV